MTGRGFKLLTIAGVRILVHPSWFVIFALVVASLAAYGGSVGVHLSTAGRWAVAVLVAVLFFASVLAHEMAHALVARRRGLAVNEITLFLFGGAASMEQEAPDPTTEALVAGAGPATSGVIGLVLLGATMVIPSHTDDLLGITYAMCYWLGVSNLLLAIFNLIPGFPMDGGRLLRALIWGLRKDFVAATRIASVVGRGFGYLIIGLGMFYSLQGEITQGIWLVLIGWFLQRTAALSYRQVAFEQLVEGIRVRDVMDTNVPVVSPNLTLDTLVDQHLLSGQAGLYAVTMDGDLVGTIDIGQIMRVPRTDWQTTRVTDVMRRGDSVVTLTEPQTLMEAVNRLEESGAAALPVVDEKDGTHLLGILTRDGVLQAVRARRALRASAPS